MYNVQFESGSTFEFVSSLGMCIQSFKATELNKWRKELFESLPKETQAKLIQFEGDYCLGELIVLVIESTFHDDVQAFIQWFRLLSPGDIYAHVIPYTGEVTSSMLKPLEWRDGMLELFEIWDRDYFSKVDLQLLDAEANKIRSKHAVRDIDFVESVLRGMRVEPSEELKSVILIPKQHGAPANLRFDMNSTVIFLYSIIDDSLETTMSSVAKYAKALGDEGRLRILRHLEHGPARFTDIVKYAGIPKSSAHNHLLILRDAGFVTIIMGFRQPDKYAVNKTAFQEMNQKLNLYLSGK